MLFGQTLLLKTTITFDELDAGLVVYHCNHLKLCDRARNQCFAMVGWPLDAQLARGEAFTVFSAEQTYFRPLRMQDIWIANRIVAHSGRSITTQHAIYTKEITEDEVQERHGPLASLPACAFIAQVKLVYIASGAALPMPPEMRASFRI